MRKLILIANRNSLFFFFFSNNTQRHAILQVFTRSERHMKKIMNVEEVVKRISPLLQSNDPLSRALTLRYGNRNTELDITQEPSLSLENAHDDIAEDTNSFHDTLSFLHQVLLVPWLSSSRIAWTCITGKQTNLLSMVLFCREKRTCTYLCLTYGT